MCKPGFIGHECETEVDECNSDPSDTLDYCYNGSKCERNGDIFFSCNCDKVNEESAPTDTKVAGLMCQYESTSMCAVSLVGTEAPNHQFCANHGECIQLVTGGEHHPGCVCKNGWMGDHCEIRLDPFALPRVQGETEENSKPGAVLWSLLVIPAVLLVCILVMRDVRSQKEKGANGHVFEIGKLSVDNIDADGSGTLGSPSSDRDGTMDNGYADGDKKEEDFVPETQIV